MSRSATAIPLTRARRRRAKFPLRTLAEQLRWQRLRFVVLKRDRYRCQLCGVAAVDGPQVRLHVDHKVARSRGGKDTMENCWTLCRDCNLGKGALHL